MPKKFYIFLIVITVGMGFSGCKDADIVFPDIAGTWDWVITFTTNTCDDSTTQQGYVVITRNDSSTDTTTGTIMIYISEDINLTCPLWTLNYTLDSNGNLTVNQTLPFDPQHCSINNSSDTMGDMQMNLLASDVSISGTFLVNLYDPAMTWNCQQGGDLILSNKH